MEISSREYQHGPFEHDGETHAGMIRCQKGGHWIFIKEINDGKIGYIECLVPGCGWDANDVVIFDDPVPEAEGGTLEVVASETVGTQDRMV